MLLGLIVSLFFFAGAIAEDERMLFGPGIVCNFEVTPGISGPEFYNYFCMKPSDCEDKVDLIPSFPIFTGGDQCKFLKQNEGENYKCCPKDQIIPPGDEWRIPTTYAPGLKSHLMCRHYLQTACPAGSSSHACEKFTSEMMKDPWHPSSIKGFPHIVQIGYKSSYGQFDYVWYCLGNLITDKYILTTASCEMSNGTYATHIRYGEDKECTVCNEKEEKANVKEIRLFIKYPFYSAGHYYHDIALIELSESVAFSHTARPACLLTQSINVDFNGFFTGYGAPESIITTGKTPNSAPIFQKLPSPNTLIRFKIRGLHGDIILAEKGRPYAKEPWTKVNLLPRRVTIQRSYEDSGPQVGLDAGFEINEERFVPFWIRVSPDANISVGLWLPSDPDGIEEIHGSAYFPDSHYKYQIGVFGVDSDTEADWIFEDIASPKVIHSGKMRPSFGRECLDKLKHDSYIDSSGLRKDMLFCARDADHDFVPCHQDWGGALVTTLKNNWAFCSWHIFGIFAKPERQICKETKQPVIFVNVTHYIPWIESLIYKDFKLVDLQLGRPDCLKILTDDQDRC